MTDTKEIKEKLRNGEEVSVSEIFSKNEQNDDLDKLEELALMSIEKSKEDNKKRQQEEEQRAKEMKERFPQAVKDNKIEEVKDLIAKDCSRKEYYDTREGYRGIYVGIRLDVPSAEMAQILIDDARQSGNKSSDFEEALICKCIELHPEKFDEWDKLAKDNEISHKFETSDINIFEKCVKAGASLQCYDFDTVYRRYVNAKNGYEVPQGNGPDRYIAPDPQREAELKKELLTVITMGYPVDKSFASLEFIQGIREEREHRAKQKEIQEQKEREEQELAKGVLLDSEHVDLRKKLHLGDIFEKHPDYSTLVERNPKVKGAFENGNFTGDVIWDGGEDCTLDTKRKSDLREQKFHYEDGVLTEIKQSREATRAHRWHTMTGSYEKDLETYSYTATLQPDGKFFIKENNSSWFEKDGKKDGNSEEHRSDGMIIKAQYKEGQLHGVYKELDANGAVKVEKYYDNGVDITEKRKALQRIADSKIRRDNNLKDKNLPKALENLGKAQIKFNSKIEAAFAVKKAQKEGRK